MSEEEIPIELYKTEDNRFIKYLRYEEIERLNNIINEIEKYCYMCINMNFNMNNSELQNQIVDDYSKMLDKLEELKGESK